MHMDPAKLLLQLVLSFDNVSTIVSDNGCDPIRRHIMAHNLQILPPTMHLFQNALHLLQEQHLQN